MEMGHVSQRAGETLQDYSSKVKTLDDLCGQANKDEQIVWLLIFGASHPKAPKLFK